MGPSFACTCGVTPWFDTTRQNLFGAALAVVLALVTGVMIGDGAVVLLGGLGIRKGGIRVATWVRRALAILLVALGLWLLLTGLIP